MKPVAFDYACPSDLPSALAALADSGDGCRVIAGGQSLGPMLNLRLVRPLRLVDISRIPELSEVRRQGDAWHIGATATHAMLEDGVTAIGREGMIPFVARGIAYRAVRNRGTVGGSLAHADPAGDWPLALAALDGVALVARRSGTREIPVAALAQSAFTTSLAADEILVGVRVPVPSTGAHWAYVKTCRKAGELADAAAAIVVDPQRGYRRIAIGALGGPARVIDDPDDMLAMARSRIDITRLERVVATAAPDLDAIERRLSAGTLARALSQIPAAH